MSTPSAHRARLGLVALLLLAPACAEPPPETPTWLRGQAILIEDLPELGGDYPATLIDGLSKQLVDEVNCIEPGVLVEFEASPTPGHLYTESNIPHMLRPEAVTAAEAVAAADGDWLTITSGYRDVGMQYYDYLRGQRYGFLAARPGNSRHQAGQAIDVEFHAYWRDKLIAGGWDWPLGNQDAPHFEYRDNETPDLRAESVRAFQRLWNRNHPDDPIAEDGDFGPISEARLAITPAEGFPYGGCDLDLDGHADPLIGGDDCDDERSDVNPDATDLCDDGIDQDCDGIDPPCDTPDPDPDPTEDVGLPDTQDHDTDDAQDADPTPGPDANDEPDTDTPDTPRPDTGLPDLADDDRAPPPAVAQVNDASCGCQSPTHPTHAGWATALLVLLALGWRRRQRP